MAKGPWQGSLEMRGAVTQRLRGQPKTETRVSEGKPTSDDIAPIERKSTLKKGGEPTLGEKRTITEKHCLR